MCTYRSRADISEVRIKDSGLESVEVVDNGSGIAQEDWSSIGMSLSSLRGLAVRA